MSVLVIAEHDNSQLKGATLNTVTAASQLDKEIHVLIAGHGCAAVGEQAKTINGVTKVLLADAECYQHQLAENIAP